MENRCSECDNIIKVEIIEGVKVVTPCKFCLNHEYEKGYADGLDAYYIHVPSLD